MTICIDCFVRREAANSLVAPASLFEARIVNQGFERIHKWLARAGVASRRRAEDLVREGRVLVDGRTAHVGQLVPLEARVLVDGRPIAIPNKRYIALNKPEGYVCANVPTKDELTVLDLVPMSERIYPVGRLDKDTCGLLFLTNDGDWANRVSHPRYGITKEYVALLQGRLDREALSRLRQGITIDGKLAVPKSVSPQQVEENNTWVAFELEEGRKREIRLLAAEAGHPVLYLERVRIGEVRLGHLPRGRFRDLSKKEVQSFVDHEVEARGAEPNLQTRTEDRRGRSGRSGKDNSRRRPVSNPRLAGARHRNHV